MDARWQLASIVFWGFAPASVLVDPRVIHVIALMMVEVFLGMSNSGRRAGIEETLPSRVPELQESKIVVSEQPGGRGGPPLLFTSQL